MRAGLAHRLEDAPERLIRDPVLERDVHRVALPFPPPPILQRSCPGKELAVLVERARHDAVGRVEGLLHAVAVMAVNVDVEHARDGAEELQDAEHDVVDEAEPGGLALFGVVQPAGPVDGNICGTIRDTLGSRYSKCERGVQASGTGTHLMTLQLI